jgi:two-component system, NtrC family, sensor kinase
MDTGSLRKYFWIRSISFRLHLFIVTTIVLTVLLVSYLDSRVTLRLIDSEIERDAKITASHLAEDLGRGDAPAEAATIQTWLRRSMEAESYITRIDVYRLSGDTSSLFVTTSSSQSRPFAAAESAAIRESRVLTIPGSQEKERYLKVIVPFTDAGGIRGCISLIASLRQSELAGRTHNRIAYFLVPGSVLLTMILLHFLFTRLLIRRFDRLIRAMNEASRGNLEIRAPVDHDDEIGIIARRYNEMMEQIEIAQRERDRLLEEQKTFNIQLQERVREATSEISDTNQALRQVNEDLLDTQRRLTQAERAAVAGQMAATFAHEIGSPLSAISTHLELMSEDKSISGDTSRRLNLIQEQVARITSFVEDLLQETRASMQTRSFVQLNHILQQLLLFLEQHLERQRVKVETHFSPDLPEIEANPQQLQQVFLNLLNNACDAMPDGGTVLVKTCTDQAPDGTFVVASVKDNGSGIPEEKQARIFEPFFTTKELNRGTGLGLSIAARIIRQHQGKLELHSVPGEGTLFTIRFRAPAAMPVRNQALSGKETM